MWGRRRGITMVKKVRELTPIEIRTLNAKGRYAVGGVSGLYLQVRPPAGKSWILRAVIGEKRRDIGLGSFPDIPLTDARIKARHFKELILSGVDPVQQAIDIHQAQIAAQRKQKTFEDVAYECYDAKKQGFKNIKHSTQWIGSVKRYAFDVLGDMDISRIGVNDVLLVLNPIWSSKTETASRLRQRLEVIFDHAIASETRTTSNPARWKGCLKPLLAAPESIKKKQGKNHNHHAALPVSMLNDFFIDLTQYKYTSAQALALCILTGARSGEVRGMTWDELDIPNKLWRIDAQRMKAGKTHTVPLNAPALLMLNAIERDIASPHVFKNSKGKPLSDAIMGKVIRTLNAKRLEEGLSEYIDPTSQRIITPHGFRSTFKDWSRTKTQYSDEASELALAHVSSDKTRVAYARDEFISERTALMRDWGNFCLCGDEATSPIRLVK